MSGQQPGYYADPAMPGYECYWDGSRWLPGSRIPAGHKPTTAETAAEERHPEPDEPTVVLETPFASHAAVPVTDKPEPHEPAPVTPLAPRRSRRLLVGGTALLIAGGLVGWAMGGSGSTPTTAVPRNPVSSTPAAPLAPVVASSPTPSPAASTPGTTTTVKKSRPASGHSRSGRPTNRGEGNPDLNRLVNEGISTGIGLCQDLGYCP